MASPLAVANRRAEAMSRLQAVCCELAKRFDVPLPQAAGTNDPTMRAIQETENIATFLEGIAAQDPKQADPPQTFEEKLRDLLTDKQVESLIAAGIDSEEKLKEASDEQLQEATSPAAVKKLRAAFVSA